jgi:hypothetical protein
VSVSYEYLEKMFFRLHEAKRISAAVAAGANQKEKNMCRNYECAIAASIRDYLSAHAPSAADKKAAE